MGDELDSIFYLYITTASILLFFTAFFVGAEFSIIRVRLSRIEQALSEGRKNAVWMEKISNNLDYYLSVSRFGIAVTAIGLGWLSKNIAELPSVQAVADRAESNAAGPIAYISVLVLVFFIRAIIGELAPKALAAQYAERAAFRLAPALSLAGSLFAPVLWLLNASARLLLRPLGIRTLQPAYGHSEEDLKHLMHESYQSGEINHNELAYMQNIFSFDERLAKDIMLPRTQMITISIEMDHDELMEIIEEHQYTRYPVTEDGDKDAIIGFINIKELLTSYTTAGDLSKSLTVHDLPFVHDQAPIQDVLLRMQSQHVHMAIVVDEYGGTAGVITMEDILEEIVGEIRDEFDHDETDDIKRLDHHNFLVNGRVLLSELEARFPIEFEESEDIDTIGGWVQMMDTDIAEGGVIDLSDFRFIVREMENHQIITVQLNKKNKS
ncbi:hemolysin family protein [Planococcus plakortidis]|uniref:hemolysin family protein n=1 Tax=Planococcus plakortidis TaxID=1038856 RepID=UPI00385CEC7A